MPQAEQFLAALPQTQCTRCGYPDCAAYAHALAESRAEINQCPPGGAQGVVRLARIAGRQPIPLNPDHGIEGPRGMAVIDEDWCIGCTLCLDACPTDAILGANKKMHVVIESYCTGCELCVPVCPVDCISMAFPNPDQTGWDAWSQAQADEARGRYAMHTERKVRTGQENEQRLLAKAEAKLADLDEMFANASAAERERKRSIIEAALTRARDRVKGPAAP